MQDLAGRFFSGSREALPSKAGNWYGLRTLLSDFGRVIKARRIAFWVGLAGIARKGSAAGIPGTGEDAFSARLPLRNEPSTRKFATRRGSNRAAVDYRFSQVKERIGEKKPRTLAGGNGGLGGKGKGIPGKARGGSLVS